MIKSLFVFCSLLLLSSAVHAEELPRLYGGIRPLGMGGAFTAVADDENLLFYNPAGMLHRDGRGFELPLPTVEASRNIVDFINAISDISKGDPNDPEQTRRVTDLVGNNIGEHFRLKMSIFPNLLLNRFGVGLLAQAAGSGAVHNPFGSNLVEGKGEANVAFLAAYAKPLAIRKHPMTVGMTLKGIHRQVFDKEYTIRELVEEKPVISSQDIKKGTGGALDIGFIYPLPNRLAWKSVALEPTVGLALQNIIGSDLGDAGELPFQANLGVSFKQKSKAGKLLLAVDMMDVTRHVGEDTDFAKRLHMGLEYRLPMMLTVRTGLYQGYPTFGATLNLWLIHLGYAYYVEELGALAGQVPNARHVIRLSLF